MCYVRIYVVYVCRAKCVCNVCCVVCVCGLHVCWDVSMYVVCMGVNWGCEHV